MRRIAPFLLVFFALPSLSQQTLVESIEVRVANIDVVVRDRAGNPVTGLTKDDFILLDDKVPQTITNFYEVRRGEDVGEAQQANAPAPEVPVEVRQRRIVLFVDASSLTPARKDAIRSSIDRFVEKLSPEDRVMLVAWRLGLQVVTTFTNDRAALKKGLDEIGKIGPAGEASQQATALAIARIDQIFQLALGEQGRPTPLTNWDEAYSEARGVVTKHAQLLMAQETQMIEAVRTVQTAMAGLDGKKVLVFVGEVFPQHPGTDLFRLVENMFGPYIKAYNSMNFDMITGIAGDTIPASLEQLGKDTAANGVTIYTIGAAIAESDVSSERTMEADQGYNFSRDANTEKALQSLADYTGGVAITRTSNFDLAFDTVNRDLSSYYSLGYKPAGLGTRQHNIIVKTRNPAYTVRSRQTFVTKSTDEQMEDRAIANIYVDPARNDWPITVKTDTPKPEKGKFVIPVAVIVPSTVTLLPDEHDVLTGDVSLYFVVGDAKGSTSPVLRRHEFIHIPRATESLARAKPMVYRTNLRVNAGESTLSVAIIDQLSGTQGFARSKIVAR